MDALGQAEFLPSSIQRRAFRATRAKMLPHTIWPVNFPPVLLGGFNHHGELILVISICFITTLVTGKLYLIAVFMNQCFGLSQSTFPSASSIDMT